MWIRLWPAMILTTLERLLRTTLSSSGRERSGIHGRTPSTGMPVLLLDELESRREDGGIAAELVDDDAFDIGPLLRFQQFYRADDLGEYTAPVDVGHQDHRTAGHLGNLQVGDVGMPQVDLGDAPGPLDDDEFVGLPQPLKTLPHRFQQAWLIGVILLHLHVAHRSPLDDHLAAGIGVGLEQDRVHVGMRADAAGLRLHGLGPADFAPLGGDAGVERHVLGFEGGDGDAPFSAVSGRSRRL